MSSSSSTSSSSESSSSESSSSTPCYLNPNDEFNSGLSVNKWTKTYTGIDYMSVTSGGYLNYDADRPEIESSGSLTSTYYISGDFDVRLFFTNVEYGNNTNRTLEIAALRATSDIEEVAFVGRTQKSGVDGFSGSGIDMAVDRWQYATPSGSVRLTRFSGEVRAYVWNYNTNRWEWDGATSGAILTNNNTDNVKIGIKFDKPIGAFLYTDVDYIRYANLDDYTCPSSSSSSSSSESAA